MKTSKLFTTTLLSILFLASCTDNEVRMTTTINRNGSCLRTVSFAADSNSLLGTYDTTAFMAHLLADSLWDKEWLVGGTTAHGAYPMTSAQYGSLRDSFAHTRLWDSLLIAASRRFRSTDELAEASPLRIAKMPLKPQVQLTKKFRWFCTWYTYTETYPSQSHLFVYPLDEFLDSAEASYWFTGTPDLFAGLSPLEKKEAYDQMEEKTNSWLVANYVATIFDATADHYDLLPNPPLDEAEFLAHRDSLIRFAIDNKITLGEPVDSLFSAYFQTDYYTTLPTDNSPLDTRLEEQMDLIYDLLSLKVDYRLVLPGTVVDPGMGILEGDTLCFRLTGARLIPSDYTITATSRAGNVWAYLVLIALCLVVFFWQPIRARLSRR